MLELRTVPERHAHGRQQSVRCLLKALQSTKNGHIPPLPTAGPTFLVPARTKPPSGPFGLWTLRARRSHPERIFETRNSPEAAPVTAVRALSITAPGPQTRA
jgi:hypothetical protein